MLFAATLLCGPKARASATYIHSCTAFASSTGDTASCALTVTAGHFLVVGQYSCGPGFPSNTFGDSFVQTSGLLGFVNSCSFRNREITLDYACASSSGADTMTLTTDGVIPRVGFIFAEYSGITCPALEDGGASTGVVNSGTSVGAGTISSGNKTTGIANDFLISIGMTRGATTLSQGTGYTVRNSVTVDDGSGANMTVYLEDGVSTVAGTYSATFAQSGAEIFAVAMGAFGASPPSGGGAAKRKHPPQIVRWLRATRPGGKWNA